jgi:hypothetical protein
VTEDLGDVPSQATGRVPGVQFRLDHDPTAHDVESAGEP